MATLARGILGRGAHEFEWDGRGRDGRAAGAGMYLVRLATPTETRVVRAALLP